MTPNLFFSIFRVKVSGPYIYYDPGVGFSIWNYEKEFPLTVVVPDKFNWDNCYEGPRCPAIGQIVNIEGYMGDVDVITAHKIWVDEKFDPNFKESIPEVI